MEKTDYNKKYYEKNKEKLKLYSKEYRKNNKEKVELLDKKYKSREEYKEERKKHDRKYYKNNTERWRDYVSRNREKVRENKRRYGQENKERLKDLRLQKEFGISLEQYNKILLDQNNVCAICGNPETKRDKKYNTLKSLAVDHNHSSGIVRGLLCSGCNLAIGSIKENIESAKNLVVYLEKWNSVHLREI